MMFWLLAVLRILVHASPDPAVEIFSVHEGNFSAINNPSMILLSSGRLIVFAEARMDGGGDSQASRIGIKSSDDHGQSWGAMRALMPQGLHPASTLSNYAAFVVPHAAGAGGQQRASLVFSVNNTLVYTITSDDAGDTWSPPTDLTPSVKEAGEGWMATGPSNAIVLRSGRVLVPMDTNVAAGSISIKYELVPGSRGRNRQCPMASLAIGVRGAPPAPLPPLHYTGGGNVDPSVKPGAPLPPIDPCPNLNLANLFKLGQRAYALISDDGGGSWARSAALPLLASETAFAELPDGRVLARSRLAEAGWQDGCHHFAVSNTSGRTWEMLKPKQCVEDPGVQTAMLAAPSQLAGGGGRTDAGGAVLMASPRIDAKRCGDHLRGALTLYRSANGGVSWETAAVVHEECSGYSSMVALDDGHVGVAWATAGLPGGGSLLFRKMNLSSTTAS